MTAKPYMPIPLASGESEGPPYIGKDPALDYRRGTYLVTKPYDWTATRWDAYLRGLGYATTTAIKTNQELRAR